MSCYQTGSMGEKKSWSVKSWQQGEADLGGSTHTLLEWGCSLWIMSRRSTDAFNEQNGHEKVVLVMRRSAVIGSLVSQQAEVVYGFYGAEMHIKV